MRLLITILLLFVSATGFCSDTLWKPDIIIAESAISGSLTSYYVKNFDENYREDIPAPYVGKMIIFKNRVGQTSIYNLKQDPDYFGISADAGDDFDVSSSSPSFNLNGSGSTAKHSLIVSYFWSAINNTTTIVYPNNPITSVVDFENGKTYFYSLKVVNDYGMEDIDTVKVTINAPPSQIQVMWDHYTSDPLPDINNGTIQLTNSQIVPSGEAYTITGTANGFYYFVFREPSTEPIKTKWVIDGFNSGEIPDQIFLEAIVKDGYRYYVTRGMVNLDLTKGIKLYF